MAKKSRKQLQLSDATTKQLEEIAEAVGCTKTLEELASEKPAVSMASVLSACESVQADIQLQESIESTVKKIKDEALAIMLNGESFELSGCDIDPSRIESNRCFHPEISPLTKEEESIAEAFPRFRPRDCVQCTARRPTRSSYSRVYCTKGNTRYIRCGWKPCGYRYKQVEE